MGLGGHVCIGRDCPIENHRCPSCGGREPAPFTDEPRCCAAAIQWERVKLPPPRDKVRR